MPEIDPAALIQARELLSDLQAASRDARSLAAQFAALLIEGVDSYCSEFDKRAKSLLEQLGDAP